MGGSVYWDPCVLVCVRRVCTVCVCVCVCACAVPRRGWRLRPIHGDVVLAPRAHEAAVGGIQHEHGRDRCVAPLRDVDDTLLRGGRSGGGCEDSNRGEGVRTRREGRVPRGVERVERSRGGQRQRREEHQGEAHERRCVLTLPAKLCPLTPQRSPAVTLWRISAGERDAMCGERGGVRNDKAQQRGTKINATYVLLLLKGFHDS